VYQVGECDGIPYFTMKLAAGGTSLRATPASISGGQWTRIADLVIALADAVRFAHQRGTPHRDL
jgi:serine/threonine-protein kinase